MGEKDIFDKFLEDNGHKKRQSWESDYNKKKCPECFSLHSKNAEKCSTCEWTPIEN